MKATATERALESLEACAEIIQTVTITTEPLATTPSEFSISKKANQQVQWVTDPPGQQFVVEFPDESPFYETQFNQDFPFSGMVRRNVLGDHGKRYKYTVRAAGRELDPTGIINP